MQYLGRALALFVLAGLAAQLAAADGDGWSTGRATFYGDDGGASIHSGSCGFGQLDGSKGTGWDVAALSDHSGSYAGSCGRCYEVSCNPAHVKDSYGANMDRNGACKGGSVTVMITDSCPCNYPSNYYSNQRWCCGDMFHMDLSKWAFQKIADTGAGVIGIKYRQVSCPGGGQAKAPCNWGSNCSGGSSSSSSSSGGSSSSSSSQSSSGWKNGGSSSSSYSSTQSNNGGSSSSSSSTSSGNGNGNSNGWWNNNWGK